MATIERRDRNGRTTYRVRYRDPAGRQRSKSFGRRADAERWMTANERAKHQGAWIDPAAGRITFGAWAERWYATTARLSASTQANYRVALDSWLLPTFGAVPLDRIDVLAVKEWMAGLQATGRGPGVVHVGHNVLCQVLGAAVDGGRLPRNPARGVRRPKYQAREQRFLTAAQVEDLAAAIRPPYGTLIRFAAYTGLRPEEWTALRVKRLDLLAGRVRVAEAAPLVRGRLVWGPTKTGEARTVALPRFLCEELGRYLADRPSGPEDLVFTSLTGRPILRSGTGFTRLFKPAVAAAGLPLDVRPYDLRHTCASLLIAQGLHIKQVQAHLGHKTASITLDIYGHLFPDDLAQVAGRLEQVREGAMEAHPSGQVWPQRDPVILPLRKPAGQEA